MSAIYEVLEAETADDLADMVERAVASGRIPCGGVAVYPLGPCRGEAVYEMKFFQAVCSPVALLLQKCPPK